mmetsp:Transcript_9608/g.21859  ORF Transcript_9608/g.21859 Transcript_9608/m.21859 type:complete len:118 (+) Transcript_9608:718-1071(+)
MVPMENDVEESQRRCEEINEIVSLDHNLPSMESLYTSRFLPPPSTATARNLLSPTPREASADTEQDRLAVETCRDRGSAAGLSRRDSSPQKPPGEAEHADYPSASALADEGRQGNQA